MTSLLEDYSTDAMDFSPDGETDLDFVEDDDSYDDALEYDDSEDARSRARARHHAALMMRRRQQLATLHRGRMAAARRAAQSPAPTTVSSAVRRTQAAVKEVGLENKVRADALNMSVRATDRRTAGLEYAVGSSIVVSQLQNAFGHTRALNNTIAKIGLPLTPLLFLKRPRGGPLWKNPQVAAPVLVAAIFAGKEVFSSDDVYSVEFTSVSEANKVGNVVAANAVAKGWRGQVIRGLTPTLTTNGPIAPDPTTGLLKIGGKPGDIATITAEAGGQKTTYVINIE